MSHQDLSQILMNFLLIDKTGILQRNSMTTLILGAGLAGLSCAYHLGHENCLLLEKNCTPYGHISSEIIEGYTWDQGPHVSFTKNEYVKKLFSDSVNGKFEEYEVIVRNYFNSNWIDHPAQSFLYQIPEPLRSQCLDSFIKQRSQDYLNNTNPVNYLEWLENAYGEVFARYFPVAYTKKYWTCDPLELTVDWVGERMYYPSIEDVMSGSRGPTDTKHHYINKVRYPSQGGYQSFARKLIFNANIKYSTEIVSINLKQCKVFTATGGCYEYSKLINTLPLPVFISLCMGVPPEVSEASNSLLCTQLSLVNFSAPHPPMRKENWMYVYDEDKLSTRINRTESLSPLNAPVNSSGVQVEVYSNKFSPLKLPKNEITNIVFEELIEMGLLDPKSCQKDMKIKGEVKFHPWANIVFNHDTSPALNTIWTWLEQFGLQREADDLHPLTNWSARGSSNYTQSRLIMAGRYGQWKYYWTDDCVLRGRDIGRIGFMVNDSNDGEVS